VSVWEVVAWFGTGEDADGGGRNGDLCGVTRLAWEVVPLR
jgi:hypothetical protein